jgi:hypothetical protein
MLKLCVYVPEGVPSALVINGVSGRGVSFYNYTRMKRDIHARAQVVFDAPARLHAYSVNDSELVADASGQ